MEKIEVLGLIPARGGSKSIPRKNILPLAGFPLIAYSIQAGLSSEYINRVVVSTDDQEIAEIAKEYGADVPFLRPKKYAQDNTPDLPVFQHALSWFAREEDYQPKIVVHLRPTSPFRQVHHIDQSILRLIRHPEADSVRSVSPPHQNPYKMWRITPEGYLDPLIHTDNPESYNLPRQALPDVYWHNGYVDTFWADTVTRKESMTGDPVLPLVIGSEQCIDIDTRLDWKRAEQLIQSGKISWSELGFKLNHG